MEGHCPAVDEGACTQHQSAGNAEEEVLPSEEGRCTLDSGSFHSVEEGEVLGCSR